MASKTEGGPGEPVDPFDPAALRISGDAEISTERVLTAVPVRKPKRDEFFRVHTGEDFTMDALVVERDDDLDREVYVVVPGCAEAVLEVARRVRLFTCVSRADVTGSYGPCKLPDAVRRRWPFMVRGNRAEERRERAETLWVRIWGDKEHRRLHEGEGQGQTWRNRSARTRHSGS